MNFDDVIKNIANQTSVKRSANIGKDFRGQVSKEGVLAQKKLFLDDKKIIERFSIYDSNYDMRRFIVCVFLNKENYSINDNLKLIEKEIELFRKQLVEYGKFIQWNEKEREIYETVLDAVLEDKNVSLEEWNVLEKLHKKLNITLYKHWIIRIGKDIFDDINKVKELTDEKINWYLHDLEKKGLLFYIEKEGRKYIIPEEIAEKLKKYLGIELQDYKYQEVLNNTIFTKKDKIAFLKKKGFNVRGTGEKLNKTIIANQLKPSDFLNSLDKKILYKIITKIGEKKSGTKEQIITRIIKHFDNIYLPSEKPKDDREKYYKFYEELANRNQTILIKKGIIKKGEEIGKIFEYATNYLFEKVLCFTLQNTIIKTRRKGVNADGKAIKDGNFIVWDCKTKDKHFSMNTSERRQFIDYINEYKSSGDDNFISFLIITSDIRDKAPIRKQLTDIKIETGIDISVIKAVDLKDFADKMKKNSIKPDIKIFCHTKIYDSKYLENLCSC
jgi:hypothetical protein